MIVAGWSNGKGTFGVRVGTVNRNLHFKPSWTKIMVEIDGEMHSFCLTAGFWRKCPEFRDVGTPVIRDWLHRHFTVEWPKNRPPRFQLLPVGIAQFRLMK